MARIQPSVSASRPSDRTHRDAPLSSSTSMQAMLPRLHASMSGVFPFYTRTLARVADLAVLVSILLADTC